MDPRLSASELQDVTSHFLSAGQRNKSSLTASKGKELAVRWRNVVKSIIPAIRVLRQAGERKRRKSFSNPENIENFIDKDKNARLEEQIKLHHLQQLMHEFHIHKPDDIIIQEGSAYFPPKMEKRTPGAMNLEEFKETVSKVLKTDEYDEYLEKLFTKLDTGCTGYVDWNEFCTYLLLLYRENDYMRTKREIPFLAEPKTKRIVHNRQETTSKILAVENPLRYVTVSKEGVICVWYPSVNYEKHKAVGNYDSDPSGQKRRFKMWVTDAIYLPNIHLLAICSTSRDIHFFDVQNQYTEEFHVFGITDVPLCFDYWYDHKNPNDPSLLIFGGETGAINLLYFKQPVTQLFETEFKREGGAQKIFWTDVEKGYHNKWVTHDKIMNERLPGQPPDIIKQVRYLPDNNSIIASTTNPNRALFIADIQRLKKEYVFRLEKGVEAFDYNKNLNILVTGSLDHILRIWNPYVTSKPIAMLEGHATGVIACKIHEELMQIFSYSKDAVVKVWDIKEHSCLQTVTFKFDTSVHSMVSLPEHGHFPMHMQSSPQDLLLVTCNDYLGILKLGHTIQPKSLIPTTHDTQLCSAIYNTLFKQVVTGCDSSHIAVWDIETGSKSIVFSNAHGDEEITSMVFDESCRRLITGARNGTIKVWNFQNGHNLHKLEAVEEAEVTGILALVDKKVILAVGWSRMITTYDDTDPDNMYISADNSWKGGQLHKDDILSVDFCPPYYLATGSFDGLMYIWHLETERKLLKIKKMPIPDLVNRLPDDFSYSSFSNIGNLTTLGSRPMSKGSRPVSRNSRPNSRHRKSHKLPKGQPIPVDKLLFLKSRVALKNFEGAKLVSSEAGYLRWWCMYGTKHEIGYFYAPDNEDESVLAMCTKSDNSIIITGDTQGCIKIWQITDYCVTPSERRIKAKPPLEASWRAHDSAIVSVEYIEHTAGNYILSASTDKTARLFTLEGHYVGTFGQGRTWNLKVPSTWRHPETPFSNDVGEEQENTENGVVNDEVINNENNNSEPMEVNGELEKEGVSDCGEDSEGEQEENPKTLAKGVGIISTGTLAGKDCVMDQWDPVGDKGLDMKLKIRSHTFALGERSQTFLGSRVARQLESVKSSRIDRRNKFVGMDLNKETQKFGKLCSPFHALLTEDVANVGLPKGLPLSQRMLNRGYTSDTMTEDVLKNMDFSYGGRETPPLTEQQDKKTASGGRDGKIHTAGLRRNTVKLAPLVLKKRHTVV